MTDVDGEYHTDSWAYLGGPDGYSEKNRLNFPTVGAMGVATGDLNRDGFIDVVFASVQDGTTRFTNSLVFYNSASGFDTSKRTELPTVGCSHALIFDVNKDGWPDIVFSNRYKGAQGDMPKPDDYKINSYIYWGGPGGFTAENRLEIPTLGASGSQVADLNGDGYNDIVFSSGVMEGFGTTSYIYWGSASGWGLDRRTELETIFPEGVVVDDFNKDGFPDILFTSWMCLECDATYLYWGNKDANYTKTGRLVVKGVTGATRPTVADLSGDGNKDIIFPNGGVSLQTGEFAKTSYVYYGNGRGFPQANRVELPAYAASGSGAADLNGDGYPEVVFSSHYAPAEGEPELSQIYWGSASGYKPENVTQLPTHHAAGMTIVGSRAKR
ncbi:MAG: VCBS repeat-containing protein [Myxococcota bacterium]|jgi:hypothetical protein